MSKQIEVVEGQALARAVLEALDRGRTPDWAALDRAYREPLLRLAGARLRRFEQAHRHTPEDVLHGFLQHRVYPLRQARKMFALSALGRRPLLARLLTSLANYCVDLIRSSGPWGEAGDGETRLATAAAPDPQPLPSYDEVEGLLRRQTEAIRQGCPPRRRPRGAAYREALLLRLRLDWAGAFDGVELRGPGAGRPVVLSLALLEELTAWADEERDTPLVEGGATLGGLWQRVRALVLDAPDRQVSVEQLATLVPVSRDLWNQWVSRGRRLVQEQLGAGYGRVFALWGGQGGGA